MEVGLLWFDDNPKLPLVAKIENAVRRYKEKFGRAPNVCYVHPKTLDGTKMLPTHVKVIEMSSIQPNYFWVGVLSP